MEYELPNEMKLSKKEEQETSKKLSTRARGLAKNYLKGLFFFITLPISICKKIKTIKFPAIKLTSNCDGKGNSKEISFLFSTNRANVRRSLLVAGIEGRK